LHTKTIREVWSQVGAMDWAQYWVLKNSGIYFFKIDEFVKSQFSHFPVIPAKAGIQ